MTGRHADPVDAADAILFHEDSRLRAQALCAWQDTMIEGVRARGEKISPEDAARWMGHAYELLARLARAAS